MRRSKEQVIYLLGGLSMLKRYPHLLKMVNEAEPKAVDELYERLRALEDSSKRDAKNAARNTAIRRGGW